MLYPIEKVLGGWSLYYNTSENDINKEADENCVKISFSEEDIRQLKKNDLTQLLVSVENFLAIKVRKTGKSMVFYLWIDEMVPAIKFSLVSSLYNKLPFDISYTEIKDRSLAVNQFFNKLKSMYDIVPIENLRPCNDNNKGKVVRKKRNKNKFLVYCKSLDPEVSVQNKRNFY
jgi:hypothetical protein